MSGQEWVPEPADLRGDDRPLSPAVGPEPGAAPPHSFSPPAGPAYPPPHVVISPRPPEDADDEPEYDDEAGDETNPTDGDEPAAPRRRFGFGFRLPRFRARRDDGTETEEGEVEVIAGPDGEPLAPDDGPAAEQNDAPRGRFRLSLRLPRFGRGASAGQNEPNADAGTDADPDPDDEADAAVPEDEAAEGEAPSRRTGLLTALAIKREARVGLAAVVSFLILVAVWVNNKGRIVPLSVPPPGEQQKEGPGPDKNEAKPDGKKDGGKPSPQPSQIDLVTNPGKGGKPGAKPAKSDDPSVRFEDGAKSGGTSPAPTSAPGVGAIVQEPNPAEAGLPTAAPMATPLEGTATAAPTPEVPATAPLIASETPPPLDPPSTAAATPPPAASPETNPTELPAASPIAPMPEPPAVTADQNPLPAASNPSPMPMPPDTAPAQEPKVTEPPAEPKTPEVVPDLPATTPDAPVTPPSPPPSVEPAAPTIPMPTPSSEPAMPSLPPTEVEPARQPEPMPTPAPAPTQEATPPPMQTPPFEPVPSGPETPAPAAAPAVSGDGWVTIRAGTRRSVVSTPGGVDVAGAGAAAAGTGAGAGAAGAAAVAEVIPDGPPPRDDVAARNQAEIKLHRVARGENFWTISQRYYGEGRFYKALWAANAKEVPDIRELYVGDVVRIPPPAMLDPRQIDPPAKPRPRVADRNLAPDVSRTSNPAEGTDPRAERIVPTQPPVRRKTARDVEPDADEPPRRPSYIIRPNQTLRSIARDTLGDSRRADEILQLNRPLLRDAGDLAPGQRITLPADATVNGRRGR